MKRNTNQRPDKKIKWIESLDCFALPFRLHLGDNFLVVFPDWVGPCLGWGFGRIADGAGAHNIAQPANDAVCGGEAHARATTDAPNSPESATGANKLSCSFLSTALFVAHRLLCYLGMCSA
jgi:hypothetical protein